MPTANENPDSSRQHGSYQAKIGDVKNSHVVAGNDNSVIGDGAVVAYEGAAAAGAGGGAASGGSTARAGGSAEQSPAKVGLVARGKKSWATKISGAIAILATAAAIGLLVAGVTGLAVAGFIITAIALIVSIIPLFLGD